MSPDPASPETQPNSGIGNRLRGTSLSTRLFTFISLFAAAVGVTLVLVVPRQLDELARDSIKVRATELATVAATVSAPGLDFGDSIAVNKLLAALGAAPDLSYAVVLRADGTVFAGWNAERMPAYALNQGEALFFRDGMVQDVVGIKTASGLTGRIALGLSLARLEALRERHLVTASALAVIIFAGGAIFSLLIARLLTGPIQRMAQVAVYISQGNLARGEQLLGGARAVSQMSRDIGTQNMGGEEMAYLARAFATMLNSFRESTVKLHESTQLLTSSVKNLQTASAAQEQAIQRQADTLELTRTTAEQILRNSESAQGRAREYLQTAGEAERLGASASSTLERSLAGLTGIRGEVVEIERRIGQLGEHGKRIEEITLAVQSIADHSNVLAVNAAIEAALAGEQGKGFAVVAREFRDLANQSLRETEMVRTILADIRRATDSTIELTAAGARKIDQGLGEVRASSETLRELSRMTVESSRAMTEIAATVQQQNSEILQIFENVSNLSKLMELTISQVGVTGNAVKVIDSVSQTVAGVAGRYEL